MFVFSNIRPARVVRQNSKLLKFREVKENDGESSLNVVRGTSDNLYKVGKSLRAVPSWQMLLKITCMVSVSELVYLKQTQF